MCFLANTAVYYHVHILLPVMIEFFPLFLVDYLLSLQKFFKPCIFASFFISVFSVYQNPCSVQIQFFRQNLTVSLLTTTQFTGTYLLSVDGSFTSCFLFFIFFYFFACHFCRWCACFSRCLSEVSVQVER